MKSYIEYMRELSDEDIYDSLLGYGMFAERFPPCFSSKQFLDYSKQRFQNNSANLYPSQETQPVYFENIRNTNVPRQLSIPNPMGYERLCRFLMENWEDIISYFDTVTSNQIHKVSRIHVRRLSNSNSIFEMNYHNWKLDGSPDSELAIGMKYMVKADISKCFPSIYTHAIPWAVVGKEKAKKERNKGWYNKVDTYLRNIKDGETHGILIGPHASNIISEIILCRIDHNMVEKGWKFVRYIDDYIAYVPDEHSADQFLMYLQRELKEYDLLLNHSKTKIQKLPLATVEQWVRKINSISFITSYGKVDFKLCRSYLDSAIELANNEEDDASVIKYAIKSLKGAPLTENAKKYEQNTMFQLALIYPYLVPLIDEYIFENCGTSIEDITSFANMVYDEYSQRDGYEAMCCSVYWALKYSVRLDHIRADDLIQFNDCVLLTLGEKYFRDINNKGEIRKLVNYAKTLSQDLREMNSYWLFVYETLSRNDLKDTWKELKNNNISFLVSRKNFDL